MLLLRWTDFQMVGARFWRCTRPLR